MEIKGKIEYRSRRAEVGRWRQKRRPCKQRIITGIIAFFLMVLLVMVLGGKPKVWVFPEAKPSPNAQTFTEPITGMEFVRIKGGCFQMGDIFGDGYDWEKPVHEVCVDDFSLGKYGVTQGQWKTVMGSNPSYFQNGNKYPMENVSWNEVQDFIRELNKKSVKKYRLPTEAEWEYAARSGGKKEKWAGTSHEFKLGDYAWYERNSGNRTHPVGQKLPNGLGLYDLSGNVWEWVGDVYRTDAYRQYSRNNPLYQEPGPCRVIRGGSWLGKPKGMRTTDRGSRWPDDRSYSLGFRLAGPK